MSLSAHTKRIASDFLSAVQFLTRIPIHNLTYDSNSLSRSVKFFPLVGLLIGSVAAVFHQLLAPHLPRLATALLVIVFLAVITGCLHEDGLADTADGFGGGSNREQILVILKDSRIGSYGGVALTLSLLARILLLASVPLTHVPQYIIGAHVLCRWTTLPLSYYLPPARSKQDAAVSSQAARIAGLTTRSTLLSSTFFTAAICVLLLRTHAAAPIIATVMVTFMSGLYYQRKIGGVTGDCFGATNQLAEIAVYLTGAWIA